MTRPGDLPFGDEDSGDTDDETWREDAQVSSARAGEADEADLIEQAIEVPEDDRDFDR